MGGNKLGLGVHGDPRPRITPAFAGVVLTNVLRLAAYERPNFVALNLLAGEIAKRVVLVFGAGAADHWDDFKDRIERYAAHAGCRSNRASFNEALHDLDAFWIAENIGHGIA